MVSASISISSYTPEVGASRGRIVVVWSWEHDRNAFSQTNITELFKFADHLGMVDYALAFQDYSRRLPQVEAQRNPFSEKLKVTWDGNVNGGKTYAAKGIYEAELNPIDFLREIYPYQILTPYHLSYRIGTQSLREWIESSNLHGVLSEFAKERWIWEIPDSQLDNVRKILTENKLLTLYLPDMNRILEDYNNF